MNSIRNFFSSKPSAFGNIGETIGRFQQFARNPIGSMMGMPNINIPTNFNGTPKDMVNYLIESGQMSKDQFNQLSQMANQLQNFLPKM